VATTFAPKMISPKQSAYIASLIESRTAPQGLIGRFTEDMTATSASDLIEKLLKCPWKNDKPQVKKSPKVTEIVPEGFYCHDEKYYKVQTSKTSGKRYAKIWTGKSWSYNAGGIYQLTLADKMTAEQAKKFGKKTGNCICCGRLLTVKASVEAGIGPVCAEKYGF
jgi:hypothetical protein